MRREHIMSVLYDVALVIGGEVRLRPLLAKTLQRILYHTSFPAGLVFLEPPREGDAATVEATLDAAVGDFGFAEQLGRPLAIPAELLRGGAQLREAPELLARLPNATRPYRLFLRLPIGEEGVMVLLTTQKPSAEIPLARIFQPVMANLAKAILLCRNNDAYTASLVAARDSAQQSLAESEEKFRSITTVAQDAIMMIDDRGRIVYWNPAAERLFGRPAEAVLGELLHSLIAPQRHCADFERGMTTFRATGTGAIVGGTLQTEGVRENGEEFPVELSVSALRLKDRWHAVGVLRDISARVRDEAALRDSKKRYDDLVRRVPVGIYAYRCTADGHQLFDYVSPRFCEILGRREEAVLADARVAFAPAHPDDFDSLVQSNDDAVTGRKSFRWEGRFVVGEEIRWIEIESEPTPVADGDWVWNGVVSDVTDRILAERELRESQARLAEAQQAAQIGNWELDLATDQLSWSDGVYEIFEVDKTQFGATYEAFLAAVHPNDRSLVDRAYRESLEEHDYYEVSHRLLMPDGRVKYVHERGRGVYDEGGKPIRSIGTVQDISRLHDVEEQLHQAQKMEAVGTLVGGIAHDFNNKLAAITGNLFLARQNLADHHEALDRLGAAETLSFEAAKMVEQLLAFARRGRVEQSPLMLVSFVKEAAKLNRVAIPEDIAFEVEYADDPLPVMGDVTQLQQVFLNLLTNARDALDGVDGPHIKVSLRSCEPDAAFRSEHPQAVAVPAYACLRVADNGCGISAENVEHIFEPFFTTKRAGEGTGLGLAMVYGVVQAHQGIITVDSAEGVGTAFSVYLPLRPELLHAHAEPEQVEVPRGSGELILVADDDVHVRTVFGEVLRSLGYRVVMASDGAEAVETYRRHGDDVALVLLDIVMPNLKGPEAAEAIRQLRPDVKVLYTTGYDSDRTLQGPARDAEVLEKPCAVAEVARCVRRILGQPAAPREAPR